MEPAKGKPFDLPPLPPAIDYSLLVEDLAKAHASLARLDEMLTHLHNPALIERTFLTREAVLSSQIEGTQATIEEVFKKEAEEGERVEEESRKGGDIQEIINYRRAMREGVGIIDAGSTLSENNVKTLHRILLQSVRGRTKAPGEFRREKVWIGPPGTPIEEARYVPPLPLRIPELYGDFDRYLNAPGKERDPLVQIAVSHYQFEAIHPFTDGNGRVGRLMIPLFLYERKILSRPYLYVSKYLEEHRRDYYDLLADVSYKQAWIPWLRFFLNGLHEQAQDACGLARRIADLQNQYRVRLADFHSPYAANLLDAIFAYPIFTTTLIRQHAKIANVQTSIAVIGKFVQAGILTDISPKRKRNKSYAFSALLDLLNEYERPKRKA